MEYSRVSIESNYTPFPEKYRRYTVKLHTHTVTATPSVVCSWLSKIRHAHYHHNRRGRLVVGLGVQWKPKYSHEPHPAATLHLCVGGQCLVYQLARSSSVPLISFVRVWNQLNDNATLHRSPHILHVSRLTELRVVL